MVSQNMMQEEMTQVVEKLRHLSPERTMEVQDFIDFLRQRDEDRRLTQTAVITSETSFQRIWDNPEDAEYDKL